MTKSSYNEFNKAIQEKEYFKEVQRKIPKKRNTFFSDLDFSIRYGKAILKEKVSRKQSKCSRHERDLWTVLKKWIKFEKYMTFE